MKFAPITALLQLATLALAFATGVAQAGVTNFSADPASKVSLSTALTDAYRLAAVKGDKVLRVEGGSMLPYFGDGSVLVVRATTVDSLREGMVVVYLNRFGETVAHRIESRSTSGWTVRGANNAETDSTLVTSENLVGTVYVTLYSDPRGGAESVRLAGDLGTRTTVALAAPAR